MSVSFPLAHLNFDQISLPAGEKWQVSQSVGMAQLSRRNTVVCILVDPRFDR